VCIYSTEKHYWVINKPALSAEDSCVHDRPVATEFSISTRQCGSTHYKLQQISPLGQSQHWATAVCLKSKWIHNTLNIKSVDKSSSGTECVAVYEWISFDTVTYPRTQFHLSHARKSVVDVDKATNIIYATT